jgi:hypothetical protein
MGACVFENVSRGKTAQKAFNDAVQQAQYDHGHSGYTGTIAEKDSFKMIEVPKDIPTDKNSLRDWAIDKGIEEVDDKWGPAGCIKIDKDEWFFFGWASE